MIDRDKVIKGLQEAVDWLSTETSLTVVDQWVVRDALALLKEQLQIVRCKDCKHSEHWYGDKQRCFLWHEDGIDVFETGYCSYGERKDG